MRKAAADRGNAIGERRVELLHVVAVLGEQYLAGHLVAAEEYYKKALAFDPAFENAKRNLEIVYRKAQAEGRLRKLPAPAKPPASGEPPFTGYEVAPYKG